MKIFQKLASILQYIPLLRRKPAFVYVALGDSTVEGIGASHQEKTYPALVAHSLGKAYKQIAFHNLGKSGAKARDVLDHQLEKAIALQPQLVTISIGANDLFRRTKQEKFQKDLQLLLERLNKETKALVIINNIPDFSHLSVVPRVMKFYASFWIRRFNNVIYQQATKHKLILVDLFSQSNLIKKYPEIVSKDGLHPSDIGYALWASAIISAIPK